jgi:hypothetical protein
MMSLFLMSLKFSDNYLNNSVSSTVVVAAAATTTTAHSSNEAIFVRDVSKLMAQAKDSWIGFGANVVDFFHSYAFKNIVFTLKSISLILSLLALAAIILIFLKMRALGKPVKVEKKEGTENVVVAKNKKIFKKWAKIERKFNSGTESNYKLAILEADNLYDETLRIIGNDKEKTLDNIDEIKNAKRIRRNIVDDSSFVLIASEVRNALDAYKNGLEKLGVI